MEMQLHDYKAVLLNMENADCVSAFGAAAVSWLEIQYVEAFCICLLHSGNQSADFMQL
jgi:hypothetical protein